MILTYIVKSCLTMCLFLLFHKFFLEKEKMHEFNRIYLLAALIIALIVPFLPTGLEFFSNSSHHAGEVRVTLSESTNGEIHDRFNAMINLSWVLFTIYFLGVIIASLRFARNLYSIVGKTKKGKVLTFGNARLILVDESIAPFTFLNYIFLEKKAFENHDIDEKLLDHELTHVAQNHSWDIIFVELIAIFYWFNPLLYGYKQAIQLNHEFLADASVLSRYKEVRTYQGLLLDMIQPKNKILLASNFNFQLTQKRLKMMTKQSSIRRKTLLQLSVIPILLGVLLGFGNPVIAQNKDKGNENKEQMEIQKVKDTYFKYAQINYQTKDGQVKTVPYQKLDRSIKEKLLPPPPPPPAPPGSKETSWEIEPLPKGSMVYIKEDGSVRIGNGTWSAFPPPPPPPPPAIDGKVQAAPKPPKPPVAPADEMVPRPPKPPTPPSLVDVIDEVDEFYIDGEKSTRKKVLTLWEKSEEKIATIDVKKMENGETAMYIVTQ